MTVLWSTSPRVVSCSRTCFGSKSVPYRSNGAKNAVPHYGCHVAHELNGRGPGIHAGGDDVLDRGFVVDVQLERKKA